MKITACLLCLALPAAARAQIMAEPVSPVPPALQEAPSLEPFIITAPHPPPASAPEKPLKAARAGGATVGAGGAGLLVYSVFIAAGPVGWAAALMFTGGLTAYLSNRRLHRKDDFGVTDLAHAPPAPQGAPRYEVPPEPVQLPFMQNPAGVIPLHTNFNPP